MKLGYKAISQEGKRYQGYIDARDTKEAVSYLRAKNLIPLVISQKNDSPFLDFLPFVEKVRSIDVVFFTRQLASMISAGLTLMQSLNVLKEQVQNRKMKEVLQEIIRDVEDGRSLSKTLSNHPGIFSPVYIALIKASESSGLLDTVLLRLSDNLEKQAKLRATIRSALTYPIVVIVGMFIVMIIMTTFVIPQLSVLYQNLTVQLPLPTRIVLAVSKFFSIFWPFILGFVVALWFGFRQWHKTEAGATIIDDLSLKTPIFGRIISLSILTELTRTLGLMVGAGGLVVEALNEVADTAGNVLFRSAILGVSQRVEKGIPMGEAMESFSVFPVILVQMVKIGEQTGKLDESLLKVSGYFESEAEQMIKNLTDLLEPFIIVGLGIGVAFLIISIIAPIYDLISNIR